MDVREKTVTGMAEYIEREAAQTSCRKYSFAESYDAFAVDCILKAIPAADVAPVRHGRWEDSTDEWLGTDVYTCSKCRESYVLVEGTPKENLWHYCPNCGAKMDGGED